MKIVNRICKKKNFFLLQGVWFQLQLPAGTNIYYYDIHIPDDSFCMTAAEVASPVLTVIATNISLLNLTSTEFYKDKYLRAIQNAFTYIKTDCSTASFTYIDVSLPSWWIVLSWAEWVSLGSCGSTGKVAFHLQLKCNKLKTTWEI